MESGGNCHTGTTKYEGDCSRSCQIIISEKPRILLSLRQDSLRITTRQAMIKKIRELLGNDAAGLLDYTCHGIPRETLHLPGPDFVDRIWKDSDRNPRVLVNMQRIYEHGRLAGTGYMSILPVDQGIEHTAGASFAPNPIYFDPENIVKLALESGCSAVASTLGVLGAVARKYAHKIPFILKFNHNELLTYPTKYDQVF